MRPGLPLCPPVSPTPFTLPVFLSVSQLLVCLLLSLFRFMTVCCLLHSLSLVHSAMLHTSSWLFGTLCLNIIPFFSSSLFCLFTSFMSSVCSLLLSSPSPPCLSQLLCPLHCSLPDCCIPALPSDREGWLGLCKGAYVYRTCTISIVHVCEGRCTHLSFFGYVCMCIICIGVCKRGTCAEAESIRQRSQSYQQRPDSTELSCIPNKALLLHPCTHAQALILYLMLSFMKRELHAK